MRVGVVIGRFQNTELHVGHKQFLNDVIWETPQKLIIFVGQSKIQTTTENPLPFSYIEQILRDFFSKSVFGSNTQILILPLSDKPTNEEWSNDLDQYISFLTNRNDEVTLYGCKDSFIPSYTGKYKTKLIQRKSTVSSTANRAGIGLLNITNRDQAFGVIWATQNRFSTCFPTVDVAIVDYHRVLLARKKGEPLYRFVGGFADPESNNFELDASREAREETGLEISKPSYLGSFKIDDWRYRRGKDKIKTLFFIANYTWGTPIPSDDLEGGELKWFPIQAQTRSSIMPEHLPLFDRLLTHHYLENKTNVQSKPNS